MHSPAINHAKLTQLKIQIPTSCYLSRGSVAKMEYLGKKESTAGSNTRCAYSTVINFENSQSLTTTACQKMRFDFVHQVLRTFVLVYLYVILC